MASSSISAAASVPAGGAAVSDASAQRLPTTCPSFSAGGGGVGGDARFSCNICFEAVQEPVATQCGHLYCWPCLYRWLEPGMLPVERQALLGASSSSSSSYAAAAAAAAAALPVEHSRRVCPVCKAPCSTPTVVPIYVRALEDSETTIPMTATNAESEADADAFTPFATTQQSSTNSMTAPPQQPTTTARLSNQQKNEIDMHGIDGDDDDDENAGDAMVEDVDADDDDRNVSHHETHVSSAAAAISASEEIASHREQPVNVPGAAATTTPTSTSPLEDDSSINNADYDDPTQRTGLRLRRGEAGNSSQRFTTLGTIAVHSNTSTSTTPAGSSESMVASADSTTAIPARSSSVPARPPAQSPPRPAVLQPQHQQHLQQQFPHQNNFQLQVVRSPTSPFGAGAPRAGTLTLLFQHALHAAAAAQAEQQHQNGTNSSSSSYVPPLHRPEGHGSAARIPPPQQQPGQPSPTELSDPDATEFLSRLLLLLGSFVILCLLLF